MASLTSCLNFLRSASVIGALAVLPVVSVFCQSSSTTPTLKRFKVPTGCLTYDSVRSTSKFLVLRSALELGPVLDVWVVAGAGFPGVAAPGIAGAPEVPGGWLLSAPGMPSAPSPPLRFSWLVCSLRIAVFCGS